MHDSGDSRGFGIDRVAEVMAYLRYFAQSPPAEVLAYLGLAPREFDAAAERWSQAREAELGQHRTEISARFVLSFGRTWERLQAERPRLPPSQASVPLTSQGPSVTGERQAVPGGRSDSTRRFRVASPLGEKL